MFVYHYVGSYHSNIDIMVNMDISICSECLCSHMLGQRSVNHGMVCLSHNSNVLPVLATLSCNYRS